MVGHGGSSAGSYLADPTSPIPSHCASIVATSTLRVNDTQANTHKQHAQKEQMKTPSDQHQLFMAKFGSNNVRRRVRCLSPAALRDRVIPTPSGQGD